MKIRNWRKFQHYKHRDPPWIKLHRSLLNDREWFALSPDASKMLVNCWLLASERDGTLPSPDDIAFRLRMSVKVVTSLISQLNQWVEHDASIPLAECEQVATTETETETETERLSVTSFPLWWSKFPKKKARKAAEAIYLRLLKRAEVTEAELLAGVERYARDCVGKEQQYICHPTTWLNQGRWADEPPPTNGSAPPDEAKIWQSRAAMVRRGFAIPLDQVKECIRRGLVSDEEARKLS